MGEFLPKPVRQYIITRLGGELHEHRQKVDYIGMVPPLNPIPRGEDNLFYVLIHHLYEDRPEFMRHLANAGLNYYQSHRVERVTDEIARCANRDPKTIAQIRQMSETDLSNYFSRLNVEPRFLDQAVGIIKHLVGNDPLHHDG